MAVDIYAIYSHVHNNGSAMELQRGYESLFNFSLLALDLLRSYHAISVGCSVHIQVL